MVIDPILNIAALPVSGFFKRGGMERGRLPHISVAISLSAIAAPIVDITVAAGYVAFLSGQYAVNIKTIPTTAKQTRAAGIIAQSGSFKSTVSQHVINAPNISRSP